MEKENNKYDCPSCEEEFDKDYVNEHLNYLVTDLIIHNFPDVWKEELRSLKDKKQLAEEAYRWGAADVLNRIDIKIEHVKKQSF